MALKRRDTAPAALTLPVFGAQRLLPPVGLVSAPTGLPRITMQRILDPLAVSAATAVPHPLRVAESSGGRVPCASGIVRSMRTTGRSWRRAIVLALTAFIGAIPSTSRAGIRGLPFSRVYSLEDIGYIPRGSRLGFDAFGRVAVVHDGVYAVLNDTTWLNIADTSEGSRVATTVVVHDPDGRGYYGARASWGRVQMQPDGMLHAESFVPANPPAWTQSTVFEDAIVTRDGIYFASRSGVVFIDRSGGPGTFFEQPKASKTFRVGDRIFVSSFEQPLHYLDVAHHGVRDVPSLVIDGKTNNVVERATELDDHRALVSVLDGRIFAFDGTDAVPWAGQQRADLVGRIAVLQHLADGNIAVAITGKGVFVLTPDGELLSSLTIPQYHRVSDIASNEPGVMWIINEDSIEKILYSSGLTTFGQRLGLPLEWPMVVNWKGRTFVASTGVLYEAAASAPGTTAHFERLNVQPPNGAWSLAAWGSHLLVGNTDGIYEASDHGGFGLVTHVPHLSYLAMVDDGLCYAISPDEIALLAWDGQRWSDAVPRIPGVHNPSVVHRAGHSVWIETGAEGVARVTRKGDHLDLMMIPNEPWTTSLWANVGVVDDVVVLSGARNDRRFFRESTESWCDMPDLMRLLDRSPAWLARVRSGKDGTLWATYNEGVVRFTPRDGDYDMDATSFDLINDRYPVVQVLPDGEVWVSASRSLYHVETEATTPIRPASAPELVSMTDTRRGIELPTASSSPAKLLQVPYSQNSLTFRFFSGGYAWRRTPTYEFRLNPDEPWSALDTGSLLRFPGLHEGTYHLQVRNAGQPGTPGPPLTFPFVVLPPWHHTWPAYTLYLTLLLLAVYGTVRWSGYVVQKRNRVLEQIVRDRTSELALTMQKLNEETRVTATLAERDRLAREIHDSVQQGLSGAILQLDTTLTLPHVIDGLRARLNVVRNMVSYARQEVQHAVWDMESPLLEGNDLGGALRKLTTYVTSGSLAPSVFVTGTPVELPRATMHHLLRIAQEVTTNAIRHAKAHEITLRLDYHADAVSLSLSDDGVGFHPESVLNQAGHFGLRGIRVRAKKLHGKLTITSSPGEGTAIHVLVPLTTPAPHASDAATDAEIERPQQNPDPACR